MVVTLTKLCWFIAIYNYKGGGRRKALFSLQNKGVRVCVCVRISVNKQGN